jgi:O-antigen ligase
MSIPFLDSLYRLDVVGYILFGAIDLLMVYLTFTNRVHIMFSLVILSAAFVGSSISMLDNLSTLSRWVTIFLLFLFGFTKSKVKISLGVFLFWIYVLFGFVYLFNADSFSWQFQRSTLLIVVTLGITLAYGDKPLETYRSTLMVIAICATIFSIVNIILLPSQLIDPARYSGFAKGAPAFAMVLGALLPFTFFGFLQSRTVFLKVVCGAGFLTGAITLLFTGQRAGTVAGALSLLPLLTLVWKKKNFLWFLMIFIGIIIAGQALLQRASPARLDFLLSRYSASSGLSNRESYWNLALAEINKDPISGKGLGAAESIMADSFHNTYLEVWYDTGLLGLIFFISAQIYFFLRLLSTLRRVKDPEQVPILVLALGYFVGFVEMSIFESIGAGASNVNLIIYIFLGILISNRELFRSIDEQPSFAPTIGGKAENRFN